MVAPGVDILAAWTGDTGPLSLSTDSRREIQHPVRHVDAMPSHEWSSGFTKGQHPDWSPVVIKSALMTTAYVHDNTRKPSTGVSTVASSTPYDHGAGHINPLKALDPGLVYDIIPQDYFEYLCSQKLTPTQLKIFLKHENQSCRHSLPSPGDLNYSTLSVVFPKNVSARNLVVLRTVTNVGTPNSTYTVVVSPFNGAFVRVEPEVLKFSKKYQKLSYKVVIADKSGIWGTRVKDGTHKVRSSVAITWLQSA